MTRGIIIALVFFLSPGIAQANAGLPMLWVLSPFAIAALVPVVLIESWIVRRGIGLPWRLSLWEMSKANAVSTLVGLPLTWALLVALEMLAGYLTIATKFSDRYPPSSVGEIGTVVMSAPWLGPFTTGGYWIIPVATAALLIPFFFVSAWIEVLTVKKTFGARATNGWRKFVWCANLASYGLLFAGTLIWLAVGLARHGWSLA